MTGGEHAGRFIGQRIARREDARLLTGHGRFVDDISVPGVLHAAFVRSPVARAMITGIDTAPALTGGGVHAVFTLADLDSVRVSGATIDLGVGPPIEVLPPLSETSVQHVGDPVAIVVAESRARAEDAAELVVVDLDELRPLVDPDHALADPNAFAGPDGITRVHPSLVTKNDDVDDLLSQAATVFTEEIRQHRYLTVPMEPRGVVACWNAHAQEMQVWVSTQGPHRDRDTLAAVLGLPPSRVRVITHDVGGGFGLKLHLGREEIATVLAARRLGQPVKWIEDRWENLVAAAHARQEHARITMALDADARLLAIDVDHVADVGAYGGANLGIVRAIQGPYRVTAVRGRTESVRTNTSTRGAYRGPWMFETVAREVTLDHVARQLDIDPLELRRRNVIRQEDLPYSVLMGVYENVTPAETLDQAAAVLDYDAVRLQQQAARAEGRLFGVGIALYMEHTAQGFGFGISDAVTLQIDSAGSIHLITGVNSQGHSVETTMAQIVAEYLGVPIERIAFRNGDTGVVPLGGSTGGSRNAVFGGGAARQAALEMRERLLALAGHLLEVSTEDLDLVEGTAAVRGTPSRAVTLAELAKVAYTAPERLPDGQSPGLEVASRFTTGGGYTWSNAAHMCTCEIDPRTGQVTILRYVVSEDCGVMINPMVVEGQIAGGVVQGIGGALLEEFVYDDRGTPLTTTFLDYLLPTATDVPDIEYAHIETPSHRPGGFKGMAEGGAIGAPAALHNAVNDALAPLGVTMTSQPLSPSKLLDAISRGWGAR